MESALIRWFIAGVFLAFLASVVIADIVGRIRRSSSRRRSQTGFRPPQRQSGWKAGGRR
ncbi:hypothetical protein [Rhizorhabdus sp. FW153]|uniref:hypothetical protein n=1 Tax=Rhizorhabdus sp. FW153 TaxID=3400216 RepID=UPI003CE85DC4